MAKFSAREAAKAFATGMWFWLGVTLYRIRRRVVARQKQIDTDTWTAAGVDSEES